MSSILLPDDVVGRKEVVKRTVLGLGFKFDEEMTNTIFFTDANDIIFGVSISSGDDRYISVHFAMAVEEPVDNVKRFAAVNFVNSEYKVLKCYYRDISLILTCEFFASTEKDFSDYFKYSVGSILKAYFELEAKYPGAL